MASFALVTRWKIPPLPGRENRGISPASGIFFKNSRRYWAAHRWQAVLMLVGMALGVAVVFAVDIANQSAKRAFSLSLDTVTGRTTHQITGGAAGIDEAIYTKLRTELGLRQSAPLVVGSLTLQAAENKSRETLQLLGVDLFAEPMFRNNVSGADVPADANSGGERSARSSLELLTTGTVILGASTAARLGFVVGESVNVDTSESLPQLRLIGTVDTDRQAVFDSMAMVDISTAQELLKSHGNLSRIDLILPETTAESQIQLIEQTFPDLQVTEAARRNNALLQMTEAFHTNLLAMSLLALLVGAFLIYNTITLSVLQRRSLFGQLRVIGVSRQELFGSIMLETLIFAVVGTAAGLLLGYVLGSLLLNLVTRTINDLYFTLDVRRLDFSFFTLIKAVLIGLVAALVAAFAPAIEASNSEPVTVIQRSTVEQRASAVVPKLWFGGVMLAGLGALILWVTQHSLWWGFLALFCIVIGYSLMIPALLVVFTSWAGPWSAKFATSMHALGQYPLRSITASLSRTSVAIAALVVAVSATAGVGIMIGSFRLSVVDWLDNTLQSDIFIRSTATAEAVVPEELIKEISALSGVKAMRMLRAIKVETNITPVTLFAIKNIPDSTGDYKFRKKANLPRSGDAAHLSEEQRWQQLLTTDSVYVSEPYAYKNDLKVQDTINIAADEGKRTFAIEGIFTDYNAGSGFVVMSMETFHRYWSDREVSSIGLSLAPGADSAAIDNELRTLFNSYPARFSMRSNTEIRERSLAIFDRTFAITHVLRLLTVGVAFVGILSALMALSLERRSEFAVLRALGITPGELRNLLFLQTGLMGVIAGLLALPLGILMSWILVTIINVRSFGWTMDFSVPAMVLLESIVLAVVAALLAGWYPARKLSQMSPAEALRHP